MPGSEQRPRCELCSLIPLIALSVLFFGAPANASAQRIAKVTIVGLDYAYQAPATLPAGLTAFAFENRGKVRHELVIVRLKPGVTMDSLMHVIDSPPARRALTEGVGLLFAEPGESPLGQLLVSLAPGRTYLLFCQFQDAPDKPRHMKIGMISSLRAE
jgi:hypothetical protein